jgi:hypothetical protein
MPFVRVGTYPTRNFATLGPLELRPPFTGASIQGVNPYSKPSSTGQASAPILTLSSLQRPKFLLNSRLSHFTAAPTGYAGKQLHPQKRLFSRSYEAILPSSLTKGLSFTLVYSTRPPVSVCGTGT